MIDVHPIPQKIDPSDAISNQESIVTLGFPSSTIHSCATPPRLAIRKSMAITDEISAIDILRIE